MNDMVSKLESNFNEFLKKEKESEGKNNENNKEKKIFITYVDKKNKIKKDIIVDKNKPIDIESLENKNILEEFNIKENIKFSKSLNYNNNNNNNNSEKNNENNQEENKYGLNDCYPIEQFFNFFSAQNNRKITLHTYKYPAKGSIKGLVYYIHGLSEHSNLAANMAKVLSDNGFEVITFDLRGHGKSQGRRCFFENEKILLEDVENFIEMTFANYHNKTYNKYIVGYSLGSLLAYNSAIKRKSFFDGCVMIGPPVLIEREETPYYKIAFKILGKILPGYPIIPKLDRFTKNPEVKELLEKDPLCYQGKVKVSTAITIMNLSKKTQEASKDKNPLGLTPLMVFQGKEDLTCTADRTIEFFEGVNSEQKELILLDNVGHDVFRDKVIGNVSNDIVNFFNKNLI